MGSAGGLATAATFVFRTEPVEQTIFWLFAAGMAWLPFWYGSNDWLAWGVNAMLLPGLAASYEVSLLIRGNSHPVGIRHFGISVALFSVVVLWIALQVFALPHGILANPIWHLTGTALGRPVSESISVDRDLTIVALMRLLTAASAFWLAVQLCRDIRRANILLQGIAAIGAGYAIYGLAALKFGELPWLDYLTISDGKVGSTFINPDSFAAYDTIGLIVFAGLSLRFYGEGLQSAAGNSRLQLAVLIEKTGGKGAALLTGGFVVLSALLLTGSRGGVLAAAFGLVVLGILVRSRRGHARTPVLLLVVGVGLVIVTLLAFSRGIDVKLAQGGIYDANRISVYELTLRSIFDKPFLGYGYGTFADVFPLYRDRSISIWGTWSQAHDTYLEIFQGLGLLGGVLLILCVALFVMRCVQGALKRSDTTAPAIAVSAASAIAAHAIVDFSVQIQAVALTLSAVLGAGFAQSETTRFSLKD